MKKITLLLILLTVSFGYSQAIPVTFDSDVIVGDNWNADSGLGSVAVIDAPVDVATYGKVGQINSSSAEGAVAWQNAQLKMTTNYIDLTDATGSKIITFDYYSTVAGGSVLLKIESTKNGGTYAQKAFTTAGTGWESISVDFSTPDAGDVPNDQYSLLVFFPCHSTDFANPPFDGVFYVDNINGVVGSAFANDPAPTTDAPTPTVDYLLVNSIFSDAPAYFEPQGILYNENWSGSSRTETVTPVSSNEMLKFPGLTYQGIDFAADIQDVSARTHIHLDYWTNNGSELKLHIINNDAEELFYTIPTLELDTWGGIDIPLTEFDMDLTNVKQLMLVGTGTFFIDNIYFYGGTPSAPAAGTCISTGTTASEGSFSVGYKTTYETLANGTDVVITFELLDTDKIGVVAFLQQETPFAEVPMEYVSGQIWTKTLTGQTPGAMLSYRCKFAYSGGLSNTEYVKYEVGADCSLTNDVTAPNTFTATVGEITPFSVELLLNSNDASGNVMYDVVYGTNSKRISALAGAEKSLVISRLTGSTMYNFDVSASDLAGNPATNNAISLSAETGVDTSTACAGTSFDAQQESFEVGYNYTIETLPNGTDVKFTFELLDDKLGVVAYLWQSPPTFSETSMNLVSGKTFTLTITDQTPGATILYGCKFGFQGGLAVTKYFSYVVGDACATASVKDFEIPGLAAYPNPTNSKWTISTRDQEIQAIEVFNVIGKRVLSIKPNTMSANVDASSLSPGVYIATITTEKGTSSRKLIKN